MDVTELRPQNYRLKVLLAERAEYLKNHPELQAFQEHIEQTIKSGGNKNNKRVKTERLFEELRRELHTANKELLDLLQEFDFALKSLNHTFNR